ncbi:MAG: hypothetical protein IJO63_04045 [Bacilli bacterium]|nr:hypothetical protein [Bacilli bacterium]
MLENFKKYKLYYIVSIIVMLLAIIGFSFAFFEGSVTNNVDINYEVGFAEGYNFITNSSVNTVSFDVSALSMYWDDETKYNSKKNELTVTLENLENYPMSCTYDVVWKWDTSGDSYTITSGATKEFTANAGTSEYQLKNTTAGSTTLVNGKITSGELETMVLRHSVEVRFYNLTDIDQSGHAGKNYKGNVVVENVVCHAAHKDNHLVPQPIYELSAEANQGDGVAHSTSATAWKPIYGTGDSILSNFGNTTTSGWNDEYLAFDGSDDSVSVPIENTFQGDSTIQVRLQFNESGTRDVILGNYPDSTKFVNIEKWTDNSYRIVWGDIDIRSSANTVTIGSPVTFTLTYDSTNGVVKIYQNNQLLKTATNTSYKTAVDWTGVLLGKDNRTTDTAATPLNGNVYSLRIYDRVLSGSEVSATVAYDAFKYSYDEANYISNTGDTVGLSYLNTGYVPDSNTKLMLEYSANNHTFGCMFGARKTTADSVYGMWIGSQNGNYAWIHYGNISFMDLGGFAYTLNNKTLIHYNGNQITVTDLVNNSTISKTGTTSYFDSQYSLRFFTMADSTGLDARIANGKIYSARLWDNGVLARWFVPAVRTSDGVAGLYCLKNSTFYTSETGTHFISG